MDSIRLAHCPGTVERIQNLLLNYEKPDKILLRCILIQAVTSTALNLEAAGSKWTNVFEGAIVHPVSIGHEGKISYFITNNNQTDSYLKQAGVINFTCADWGANSGTFQFYQTAKDCSHKQQVSFVKESSQKLSQEGETVWMLNFPSLSLKADKDLVGWDAGKNDPLKPCNTLTELLNY